MSITTKIDWCDSTVNPVMGCDGCELSGGHCYAEALVTRHAGKVGWPARFDRPELISVERRMEEAIHWPDLTGQARPAKPWLDGMPRMIFCCDLADPFSESIDPKWICQWVNRMGGSRHIWILLTKRPTRMAQAVEAYCCDGSRWPENIWGGVSVTSRDTLWRVEELVRIPIHRRIISAEPLLGPVEIFHLPPLTTSGTRSCLPVTGPGMVGEKLGRESFSIFPGIHWVIAGGESGPNARQAHPDWFRSLRDQCAAVNVPFLFKQWGEWAPMFTEARYDDVTVGGDCGGPVAIEFARGLSTVTLRNGERRRLLVSRRDDHRWGRNGTLYMTYARTGKKVSGRLLDGREHLEVPR